MFYIGVTGINSATILTTASIEGFIPNLIFKEKVIVNYIVKL